MKKTNLFYLVLIILAFTNCSNDDNNNSESEIDPIIGQWILVESSENGSLIDISGFGCEIIDSLEFLGAGGIIDTFFEPISSNGNECMEIIDNSGSWERVSESQYRIILDSGDVDYTAEIVFSENNMRQVQTYILNDGGENFDRIDIYQKTE